MPGGFPYLGDVCNNRDVGTVPATSLGTSITLSTANTKTAYAQLTAATTGDCSWMVVSLGQSLFNNGMYAVDIAIGASGSEIIIASNLLYQEDNFPTWSFPVNIPSGTRISARAQSTLDNGADTMYVAVYLMDGSFMQQEGVAGIDNVTAVMSGYTYGALVGLPTSANTKTAYTQVQASTARDYMGVILYFDHHDTSANITSSNHALIDVAIGASGSEIVLISNLVEIIGYTQSYAMTGNTYFPIAIPAGTRISVRCQSVNAPGATRTFGVNLYGFYA
jgi:hypothetical protein